MPEQILVEHHNKDDAGSSDLHAEVIRFFHDNFPVDYYTKEDVSKMAANYPPDGSKEAARLAGGRNWLLKPETLVVEQSEA